MNTDNQFQEHAKLVHNLNEKPSDDELLELYGLYKQATIGDCNTEEPSFFDFKGKAKWDSWNNRKSMTPDEAKAKYIQTVKQLSILYGTK